MNGLKDLANRIDNLSDIPFRLILKIYIIGVIVHFPGEFMAPFFLSYNVGWEVIGFQTIMILSDGIGVILIYLAVSIIANDVLWVKREKQLLNFSAVAALGFVVAVITECFGVYIFDLWNYPASLKTIFGVAGGAILGWTVLPATVFLIINQNYNLKSITIAFLVIIASNFLGSYFLV